jgi:UPF0755 protein
MLLKIIRWAFLLGLTAILALATWFSLEFYTVPDNLSKKMSFEVEKGEKVKEIAQKLGKSGVIRKKWPLLLGYRLFYSHHSLKAGEYRLQLPLSTKQVLRILIEGKVYLHPLTIPEGLTRKEIAEHLGSLPFINKEKFLEASSETSLISAWDKEASTLEGYLFPETYHFPKGISEEEMVEAMVSEFKETFNQEWQRKSRQLGMSIREVVILASLIEEETSIPEERRLVSAVFHNRLQRGMKLDCDPTIIYVLKEEERFTGRLRTKDLRLDSPYNTYLYPGLPPSPICNPGEESIKAALHPSEADYLYFVSKNDGSHKFSYTLKEHLEAVRKYQK